MTILLDDGHEVNPRLPRGRFAKIDLGAIDDHRLNRTDLHLLTVLDDHCGTKPYCWPSDPRLAKRLRASLATVQRSLKRLEETGHVRRVKTSDRLAGRTGRYIFLPWREGAVPSPVRATPPSPQSVPPSPLLRDRIKSNEPDPIPKADPTKTTTATSCSSQPPQRRVVVDDQAEEGRKNLDAAVAILVDRGVKRCKAIGIAKQYPLPYLLAQVEAHDWRRKKCVAMENPAGFLVSSIKDNYDPPETLVKKRKGDERKAHEDAQYRERQAKQRRKAERDALVKDYWDGLPIEQKEAMQSEFRSRLDPACVRAGLGKAALKAAIEERIAEVLGLTSEDHEAGTPPPAPRRTPTVAHAAAGGPRRIGVTLEEIAEAAARTGAPIPSGHASIQSEKQVDR